MPFLHPVGISLGDGGELVVAIGGGLNIIGSIFVYEFKNVLRLTDNGVARRYIFIFVFILQKNHLLFVILPQKHTTIRLTEKGRYAILMLLFRKMVILCWTSNLYAKIPKS